MLSMKDELPSWRHVSHLLDQLVAMRKEGAPRQERASVSRRLRDEARERLEKAERGSGTFRRK